MPALPPPPAGDDAVSWVAAHLRDLSCDEPRASTRFRGGQAAADAALASLDLTGYARRRNQVLPETARGASQLSPYVRHGLLTLPQVWDAAGSAPPADRDKFRDELLWQEYARHVYARLAPTTASLRTEPPVTATSGDPWPREMACMDLTVGMLEDEGWLVNQTRMWMASQWSVRAGRDWREGEDALYRHLLDGSRAANRLGWQWTTGAGSGKPYGFSRWQVEKRAPGLCLHCPLQKACPVQDWPSDQTGPRVEPPAGVTGGPTDGGPSEPELDGEPDAVWLTAESLGSEDPALQAHPDLQRVFVFDAPLLRRLQLSGKRLVFLAQALAELDCEVRVGDVAEELAGRRLAVTFAPVPGFRRRRRQVDVAALHPFPWLRRPGSGSLRSWSAWVRADGAARRAPATLRG
ncbi:MAG: Deoxyribodipyrimidine photolyase-like [Frankiales bacterium]|nr:Deoxyribodipyrimidine photolyase-like [Frankiales bacterium]